MIYRCSNAYTLVKIVDMLFTWIFLDLQAIYKNAKRLKVAVKDNINKDKEGHALLQRVINLALLPPHMIDQELREIRTQVGNVVKDADKLKCWDNFFEYFHSYWMEVIKPENFSVFDVYDRTNNYAESYYRHVVNTKLGGRKSPQYFLSKYHLLRLYLILFWSFTIHLHDWFSNK